MSVCSFFSQIVLLFSACEPICHHSGLQALGPRGPKACTLSRARGGPRAPGHKHAIIISVTRNSHWRWRTHFALRGGSFRPFCRVSLRAGGVRCLYRVNNAAGIEKSLVEDKKVTEVWTRSSMPGWCRFSGCQKLLFYRVYVFVLFFFSPIVCEGNMYIVQKEMWKCNDK